MTTEGRNDAALVACAAGDLTWLKRALSSSDGVAASRNREVRPRGASCPCSPCCMLEFDEPRPLSCMHNTYFKHCKCIDNGWMCNKYVLHRVSVYKIFALHAHTLYNVFKRKVSQLGNVSMTRHQASMTDKESLIGSRLAEC